MTAPNSVDVAALLRQQVAEGHPDVLRALITAFANALMSADAGAICGADYGQSCDERVNRRNGYRPREWDTRAGTVELAVPKLRQGSCFPDWLLEQRRRAEQALVTVVATSYLLGVSTRRVEKLAEQLGVTRLSKSQVSQMVTHLDTQVEAFRSRPLDAAHYTFFSLDALTMKVRVDGRTVNVACLIAVGANADGYREVLGLDVVSDEDGAGWLAFLRSLTARGLKGVHPVISDAHRGLINAIAATLPGAAWQRCRTQAQSPVRCRNAEPDRRAWHGAACSAGEEGTGLRLNDHCRRHRAHVAGLARPRHLPIDIRQASRANTRYNG
jgi:transposase-like protein